MRAAVCTRYGTPDVIEIRQVPKPVPKDHDVLVAVHAASVGRTDCGMLAPHPPVLGRLMYGLSRPGRKSMPMIATASPIDSTSPADQTLQPERATCWSLPA